MHQHPAPQQPTPPQPQVAHDPVGVTYAAPAVPQFGQPAAYAVPQVQLQAQPSPHGQTTLRAQVVAPAQPLAPQRAAARPWGDVEPVASALPPVPQFAQPAAPVAAPQQVAQPWPALQPVAMSVYQPFQVAPPAPQVQPQVAQHQVYAAAPMPVAMPVAAPMHASVATAPMPVHAAPTAAPAPTPGFPAPQMFVAAPDVAAIAPAAHPRPVYAAPQLQVVAPEAPVAGARRASRAPQGMGSSLRLDDPSLQNEVSRARGERSELAEEYRRLTAPLVDTTPEVVGYAASSHVAPAQFVQPTGAHVVHHAGSHSPAPAHPEHSQHGIPRPVVTAPHGVTDPALRSRYQPRSPLTQHLESTGHAAPAPTAQPVQYAPPTHAHA